jgi:hypothetical protein
MWNVRWENSPGFLGFRNAGRGKCRTKQSIYVSSGLDEKSSLVASLPDTMQQCRNKRTRIWNYINTILEIKQAPTGWPNSIGSSPWNARLWSATFTAWNFDSPRSSNPTFGGLRPPRKLQELLRGVCLGLNRNNCDIGSAWDEVLICWIFPEWVHEV